MAASPLTMEEVQPQDNWGPPGDQSMGPAGGDNDPSNSAPPLAADDRRTAQDTESSDYPRSSSVGDASHSGSKNREKQVKVLRSLPVCLLECICYIKLPLGILAEQRRPRLA
jgi:hypothetical protein